MANKDKNESLLKDIAIVSCVWGPLLFIFIVGGVWRSGRFDGTIMEQLFPAILFGFVATFLIVIILSNLFKSSTTIWWIGGILAFIVTVIIYMYYTEGFVMDELEIFGMEELNVFSFILAIVVIILVLFYFKKIIWDKPHDEIRMLKNEVYNLEKQKQKEIKKIQEDYEKKTKDFRNNINQKFNLLATEKNIINSYLEELEAKKSEINLFIREFESNLSAIPYMAGMVADIETYGLENLAQGLEWGHNQERLKKVKSIREIRKDAKAIVEKNKEAQYQLAYLLELFPNLNDVIECEFNQLPMIEVNALSDYDATRDYLSKEEYEKLTVTERNQLALDRYNESHNKTKWQIGRDYEQYVGYQYRKKGYEVDDFGSYMGLEDLGRDVIAKKDDTILIIQCKYWSSIKQIHEKHITQLYGTMISYCIENNIEQSKVKGVLVTNIQLSDMAKKMATYLDINYVENFAMGKYPQIKCNIGHSEYGEKIYHLPFDQQYDATKIDKDGEFYAMTVAEAEAAGFRRAFKWFGNQ